MTTEFADVARRYCAFIENCRDLSAGQLITRVAPLLAELYLQGLMLPEGPPADEEFNVDLVSTEAHAEIMHAIDDQLGHYYAYWNIFNPLQEPAGDNSPYQWGIGDDLADIYRDMKNCLSIYDIGTEASRREAVWQWRLGLAMHWGRHLVDSLCAIHALLFTEYIGEE
jgi:hypothetical protein